MAERRAHRSNHRETGGLLLGFRSEHDVYVVDIIEVRDPSATPTRFSLPEKRREAALSSYLEALPSDSPVGYVGTWHSHPADVGPSWRDRQTFRLDALRATDLIALMVLARRTSAWHPYLLLGGGRFGRPGVGAPQVVVR